LTKPRSAWKSCSRAVKTKSAPHDTQRNALSANDDMEDSWGGPACSPGVGGGEAGGGRRSGADEAGTYSLSSRQPALVLDVLRAPPPAPVRPRVGATAAPAGRLGLESSINLLVEQRRYADALQRLEEIEAADPAMATFCAVKRRAIARRQVRGR
jgi:hypothetical protein